MTAVAGRAAATGHLGPILCICGAGALFALMTALIKLLGGRYAVPQIVFFRSAFAFVPLIPLIAAAGLGQTLRTDRPGVHAARSLMGVTAMLLSFSGLQFLPIADATAISYATPFFVTLMGIFLLGETVRLRRWAALIAGFLGVLIIVRPGADSGVAPLGAFLAIAAAFFTAGVLTVIRRFGRYEKSLTIVVYFSLTCTLVSGAMLPFVWRTPDLPDLLLLIGCGLIGGTAQVLMTRAYQAAPVSVLSPFDYTTMIWATLYGYLFWGDVPGLNVLAGTAIVAASGLYILYREAQLGRPASPPKPPAERL
ncbi:MAG TPA: DMT family transporter [Alphaproteobacteria bacterium]|nr:DMT family transporter [Alphaproteobacteria bacterium]